MKFLLVVLSTLALQAAAQQPLQSRVYSWEKLTPVKEETRQRRQVLDGNSTVMNRLEIHATTLEPGNSPHSPHVHTDSEELIIVKEGELTVTINGKLQVLGAGSVAFAMPGDEHGFHNAGKTAATYYVLKFWPRATLDSSRAHKAGSSFMLNWNDLAFTPHDKGGIRRYFERPTAGTPRFEMHVTTLNEGLKSHEPHTHKAEEIILIIQGDAEMQIGQSFQQATTGDVIFLDSQVPHALRNAGKGACMYFAFQWE